MLSNTEPLDFPARPPTPPIESGSNTKGSLLVLSGELSNTNLQAIAQAAACDTPPQNSPSSSAESDKPRKRVGFSPWTDYHKAPTFNGKAIATDSLLRQLPPSRERRSSKSILKPRSHFTPLSPGINNAARAGSISAHRYGSFAEMLESVIRQLAGEDRNGRLDSYITLEGTLKAYEGVPDPKAMAAKMGLFMDFIRRDMCATMPGSKAIDTNLATHALKLLIIFLWTPPLSESLTDEFRTFAIDRSIDALEDPRVPKALVSHHMHLLSQQDFRAKIINSDRANRLISALDEIEEHVKGNSILGERLLIYQKLVHQARGAMITRVGDWLDHLFSAMLSSIKEIRVRAIGLGINSGLALGTSSQVSRAVMDVFNRELEGGKFSEHLIERLNRMMSNKEEAMHIPQIWSVVILFLRSRRHQIEQWQHFKSWLTIIQKCFNTSDFAVKFQANIAWNRLIFAIDLRPDMGLAMTKLLRQPITGQLDRRGNDSYSRKARNIAFASYCNLLYYSLRPSSSLQHLDYFWDGYVSQVLQKTLAKNQEDVKHGCQILTALLDTTQSKVWNENRANELTPVKPEELPRLDPRWVRSRAHVLLTEIEPAVNQASWNSDSGSEAPAQVLWGNFMRSIADAGNKEVKMSSELIAAIAQIFNMLRRFWLDGTSTLGMSEESSTRSDSTLERLGFLVITAIDCLGAVHFTEKVLTRDSQSMFEAACTPSNRPSKNLEAPRSPLLYLLELLLVPRSGCEVMELYYTTFKDVLKRCCYSRSSRRMRLELLRESAQLLPELSAPANEDCCSRCWQAIAELTKASLEDGVTESPKDSSQQAGHEYRDVVKILNVGMNLPSGERAETWAALYVTLATLVKKETGDGGLVLAVVEPLADTLRSEQSFQGTNAMLYGSLILDKARFPKNQQALDVGHRRLWDVVPFTKKTAVFRPFDHLYQMIDNLLTNSYRKSPFLNPDQIVRFLASLATFVYYCPLSMVANFLKCIQDGVGRWLEDAEYKIKSQDEKFPELGLAITSVWINITGRLRSLKNDSALLQMLETLIACGLKCCHRMTVTAVINYWNSTFGQQESLEYPPKVRSALGKLKSIADLQLPTFPESAEDEIMGTPHRFRDTQDNSELVEEESSALNTDTHNLRASTTPQSESIPPASRRLAVQSLSTTQSRQSTPEPHHKRTPSRKATTARLRHDDSQIVFAMINSSPLDTPAMESQLMTDRQREVRDRQRAEAAAMFPDIRSSPRIKHPHSKADLPPLTLSSDRPSTGNLVVDGPLTPTLPPTHMDGFLGSSPTPRPENSHIIHSSSPPLQKAVPAELSYDESDIPSSPPQIRASDKLSAHTSSFEESRIEDSLIYDPRSEPSATSDSKALNGNQGDHAGDPGDSTLTTEEINNLSLNTKSIADQTTIKTLSDRTSAFEGAELPKLHHQDCEVVKPRDPAYDKDQSKHLVSSANWEPTKSDVFTDALSSPLEHSDAQDQGDEVFVDASQSPLRAETDPSKGIDPRLTTNVATDDISGGTSPVQDDFSRVLDSIYDDGPEQSAPENDQSRRAVATDEPDDHLQDIRQASVAESRTSSQASRTKKRKRATSKIPKRKRSRKATSEAGSQSDIISAAPQDDVIYDCIVVDDSQVTASPALPATGLKAEQSPSPVKGTQDPFSPPFRVIIRKSSVPDLAASQTSIGRMSPKSRKRLASGDPDDEPVRTGNPDNNNDLSHIIPSSTLSKRRKSSRLSRSSTGSVIEDRPDEGLPSLTSIVDDTDSTGTGLLEKDEGRVVASAVPLTTTGIAKDGMDIFDAGTKDAAEAAQTPPPKTVITLRDESFPDTDQALEDQINAEITSSRSRTMTSRPTQVVEDSAEQLPHCERPKAEEQATEAPNAKADASAQHTEPLMLGSDALSVGEKPRAASPTDDQDQPSPKPSSEDGVNGRPTIHDIKDTLRKALQQLQQATLVRDELRELDDVLFDVRTEAHQASRRSD